MGITSKTSYVTPVVTSTSPLTSSEQPGPRRPSESGTPAQSEADALIQKRIAIKAQLRTAPADQSLLAELGSVCAGIARHAISTGKAPAKRPPAIRSRPSLPRPADDNAPVLMRSRSLVVSTQQDLQHQYRSEHTRVSNALLEELSPANRTIRAERQRILGWDRQLTPCQSVVTALRPEELMRREMLCEAREILAMDIGKLPPTVGARAIDTYRDSLSDLSDAKPVSGAIEGIVSLPSKERMVLGYGKSFEHLTCALADVKDHDNPDAPSVRHGKIVDLLNFALPDMSSDQRNSVAERASELAEPSDTRLSLAAKLCMKRLRSDCEQYYGGPPVA